MKLFLAALAKDPVTLKSLDTFVGGLKGKKIAYIPTAANGEGWDSWKEGGSNEIAQSLGADVEIVLLEESPREPLLPKLQNKDIIWVAGGFCGYLMYWIRRTKFDAYLPQLFKDGAVYVGSSAGACVAGMSLEAATWPFSDEEIGADTIPSMQLFPFDIYPHYRDDMYEDIKKLYTGNKMYLLKNGEQILIDGDTFTLQGEERIIGK